jgi:hypothetical protein
MENQIKHYKVTNTAKLYIGVDVPLKTSSANTKTPFLSPKQAKVD